MFVVFSTCIFAVLFPSVKRSKCCRMAVKGHCRKNNHQLLLVKDPVSYQRKWTIIKKGYIGFSVSMACYRIIFIADIAMFHTNISLIVESFTTIFVLTTVKIYFSS